LGPDTTEAAEVRPFAEVLSEVNKGVVADEAASELAKLVTAVKLTGKKGRLTLIIDVAPMAGNDEVMKVSGAVTVRAPRPDAPTSIFYAGEDGVLTRNDPNALPLFPATDIHGATR
jgi:hypothetical protein